jgi:2-dehydro-3-deoxygalactonokinase
MNKTNCFIAVDAGTTNMRVWLVENDHVRAHAAAMVGVRNTAQDGHNRQLVETLRGLIEQVSEQVGREVPAAQPASIAAAGMITSPLGLREVPHVAAPADAALMARHAWRGQMPAISDLPLILFPGVRSGEFQSDEWWQADVMRGEETLCVGLLQTLALPPPYTILNLGSHWKAIEIDEQGRIARSRTSLSGELIYATQTTTILASAVPDDKLQTLDDAWCEKGMREAERSGVARALFCVRLLELQKQTTPAERMSFLLGVFIAADLAALLEAEFLHPARRVLLTGSGAVAEGWLLALKQKGISRELIPADAIEQAYLRGIRELLDG